MARGAFGTVTPTRLRNFGSGETIDTSLPVTNALISFVMFPAKGKEALDKDGNPTGYVICKARDEDHDREVVLKGNFGPVAAGQMIRIAKGFWKEDGRGLSYVVRTIDHSDPITREAVLHYLTELPGVGDKLAEAIVDELGSKPGEPFDGQALLERIDRDPTILQTIKSASGAKIRTDLSELIDTWQELRGKRKAMLFLSSVGLGDATSNRIITALAGSDVVATIKADPYTLCEIDGIGFRIADSVGRKLGIGFEDERRLSYGILHTLKENEREKHVCMRRTELISSACELLGEDIQRIDPAQMEEILNEMLANGRVIRDDPGDGSERFYHPEIFLIETRLYQQLENLLTSEKRRLPSDLVKPSGSDLTDEQWQAIENGFAERLSILTGGPGCGKTYSVNGLIQALEQHNQRYICLAPTGKASKRMSEATDRPASTIHRALGSEAVSVPKRVDDEPDERLLEADVVIIDEVSMADMRIFERVLSHIGDKTRVVLVGDPDQLPSVGVGSVLHDLLESKRVPTAALTQVFRQRAGGGSEPVSLLVLNAHRIKDGKEPYWNAQEAEDDIGMPVKEDWRFIEVADVDEAREQALAQIGTVAGELGIDEKEVFVTAPFRMGRCGVWKLNQVLQERYNPHGEQIRGGEQAPLRLGDTVMNIRNRYLLQRNPEQFHDVFNGDIGTITDWNPKTKTAWVDFGEPQGPQAFSGEELDNLVPAYAATTHKLQGSESPAIVAPLLPSNPEEARRVIRNLPYTAWTRAKKLCVVVSSKEAVRAAIANTGVRQTTLDLRVGKVPERMRARWEVIADHQARWAQYAETKKLPYKRIRARNSGVPRSQARVAEPSLSVD